MERQKVHVGIIDVTALTDSSQLFYSPCPIALAIAAKSSGEWTASMATSNYQIISH
jgi:hypothetical protein